MAISVEYNGNPYRFGFTRATAQAAEREGFIPGQVMDKPNLMIPIMTYHAATTYQKKIKRNKVEKIVDSIREDKEGFLSALVDEYVATTSSLFDDSEQGNATWKRD